ncbi:MAG: UxaA family hydrolase [Proteobacteria bacterium]|nr:UxaA family hydrolase [Pseudomonadota bacterium]
MNAASAWNAIAIDARDTVAVVLRDIAKGEAVAIRVDGRIETLVAAEDIALGHKISRQIVKSGAPVLKYGETIASATRDIGVGQHVHVHNVTSNRARKARQ